MNSFFETVRVIFVKRTLSSFRGIRGEKVFDRWNFFLEKCFWLVPEKSSCLGDGR